MPKKDGRGRISDIEIKHIRKLKQKGHSTAEIAEMTGWGIRTVRDAVSGAIYAQREKAKQRYADKKSLIEACEQTQTTLEGMLGGAGRAENGPGDCGSPGARRSAFARVYGYPEPDCSIFVGCGGGNDETGRRPGEASK